MSKEKVVFDEQEKKLIALADSGDAAAAYEVAGLALEIEDKAMYFKYSKMVVDLSNGEGENVAMSLEAMAHCYEQGESVEQDLKKAFDLYVQAATLGNDEAQFKVGEFYMNGIVVETSLDKAIEWFSEAAKAGHSEASHNLAHCKKLKKDLW